MRVRAAGPKQLRAIAKFMARRGVPLVSNQVQYSLLSRNPERSGACSPPPPATWR